MSTSPSAETDPIDQLMGQLSGQIMCCTLPCLPFLKARRQGLGLLTCIEGQGWCIESNSHVDHLWDVGKGVRERREAGGKTVPPRLPSPGLTSLTSPKTQPATLSYPEWRGCHRGLAHIV